MNKYSLIISNRIIKDLTRDQAERLAKKIKKHTKLSIKIISI